MPWSEYKIGTNGLQVVYLERDSQFSINYSYEERLMYIELDDLDALISTLLDFRASFEQEREHEAIEAAKIQGRAELRLYDGDWRDDGYLDKDEENA